MKRILATVLLFLALSEARGSDLAAVLDAIAQVEGNRPAAVGRANERSRWQMREFVWHSYTRAPFRSASRDEILAKAVARAHLQYLERSLVHRRIAPTPYNLALAWTCGLDGMLNPPAKKRDYARRVTNLVLPHNAKR